MGKAVLKGSWRASLNRFNLCSLVRLITIYKYRSGRNENEGRFKSKERVKTPVNISLQDVFPKSSCFSSGDRKPELLLCGLINVMLWYLLQVRFATGASRCSFQPFLRHFCISLIIAPWDKLCSRHSTEGGK